MLRGFFGTTLKRLWPQTPKDHKKTTFRGTFFGYIFDRVSYFSDGHFLCVFKTSLVPDFGAKGTRRLQFRRVLGASWNTFGTNVEKLKLRFCVGWYSKIKLWRACISPCFVISMRKLLGHLICMLRLTICHHFTHLCIHWKPIFNNIL